MTQEKRSKSSKEKNLETIQKVLKNAELDPKKIPNDDGYKVDFTDGPSVRGIALLYDEDSRFVFYLDFLTPVPEKSRLLAIEFLTRANFGIVIGNFEIDHESGLVRFKTSLDFAGLKLSEVLVRNLILDAMDAVELYAEGLRQVVLQKQSPLKAIQDVEEN